MARSLIRVYYLLEEIYSESLYYSVKFSLLPVLASFNGDYISNFILSLKVQCQELLSQIKTRCVTKLLIFPEMATSSLSTESFKMPSEPCPLPSLGSDEESFVVLWKDMDSKSIVEINHEPIGTSVVEEAKQLINKELTDMEQMSLANKEAMPTENNLCIDAPTNYRENTQMDQSTVLPKMPQVEKGFVSFFFF